MDKSLSRRFCLFASTLLFSLTIFSCSSYKKVPYFQDIPDSGQMKTIPKTEYAEPVIQVDDILTILIQTFDPQATTMINAGNIPVLNSSTVVSNTISPNMQSSAGYLVDKAGVVEIPILGKIQAVGLTTTELREKIRIEAVKYLKDPTVAVRFANFKVSLTGEVARPGQYIVPNEKVSIIDALAMAGDLTIFGKRDNVLLIRENADGSKSTYRANLNKSDVMSAPYYYLKQNDVIYVEPNKSKAASTDANQARTYTIVAAALSLIIVFLTRVKL